EFILIETESLLTTKEFFSTKAFTTFFSSNNYSVIKVSKNFTQKLTHQTINGRFIHIHLVSSVESLKKYSLVSAKKLDLLPFPKFINSYLKE
ncbi:MAG: hypothetical protein ACRDE8_12320, partial [Ginsengibacter sp.]